MKFKLILLLLILVQSVLMLYTSCSGVDRSDEQPLPPKEVEVEVIHTADSCLFVGHVAESHNSPLMKCGFYWNNGKTVKTTNAIIKELSFEGYSSSLEEGRHFVVAFATNGVGTTNSDTLWFDVIKP